MRWKRGRAVDRSNWKIPTAIRSSCSNRGDSDSPCGSSLRTSWPAATLHAVRRTVFNRWAVAILLVTRLVLGEFVHAHDGGHSATGAVAVAQESAHCHDDAEQTSE